MPTITNQNYYNTKNNANPVNPTYNLHEEKEIMTKTIDEVKKDILRKWQKRYSGAQIFPAKFNSLNPAIITDLLSFENTLFYDHLAEKFSLTPAQRNALPQIIWKICFDKNWQDLENLVATNLDTPEAREIAKEVSQNILIKLEKLSQENIAQAKIYPEKTSETQIAKLSLSEALEKYPDIGEQLITKNRIKLKIFPEPVRPSIKSWLSDYTFTVGISNHDPLVRGNYIFQSQNSSILSHDDRQKLTVILKSFEEKDLLTINTNTKQIIFDAPKKKELPRKSVVDLNSLINQSTGTRKKQQEKNNQPQQIFQPPLKFQSDEERISAWRKDLPQKEQPENKLTNNNSPQTPSPQKITDPVHVSTPSYPIKSQTVKSNYINLQRPLPKNVVNLKEK